MRRYITRSRVLKQTPSKPAMLPKQLNLVISRNYSYLESQKVALIVDIGNLSWFPCLQIVGTELERIILDVFRGLEDCRVYESVLN